MALYYNNINIPSTRNVYINNKNSQGVYYNNALAWRKELVLYDGPSSINITTPITFVNAYENKETTYKGVKCWVLTPWTAGDPNERLGAVIRSTNKIDLSGFTKINCTWAATRGYGGAAQNDPRCSIYTSYNANQDPYNTSQGFTSYFQIDGVFLDFQTRSFDISGVTGEQYVYVGNWAAGGTSGVLVRNFWLS